MSEDKAATSAMSEDKSAAAMATIPTIDLRHVYCGLVPAILDELSRFKGEVVDVLIRAGIEPEIISGFGTGGDWDFLFLPAFGHGRARFTRRPREAVRRARLDILDY